MEKTDMRLIILVMVAFILLPASVIGQNITNSTVIPTTTGTAEPTVTTQVPTEITTTIPVTHTTQVPAVTTTTIPNPIPTTVISTNTTPLQVTTNVSGTTMTTGIPTATPVTQVSTGNIIVASSPLGASIIIDGMYYGTTLGNITGLPAGNHIVRLSMSGYYDYEGTLYVVPGQVTHVFGTLPPLSGTAPQISQPVTIVPVTTTVPITTLQVTQNSGAFESPTVIAAIIGIITACIGAAVTLFTHNAKIKKE